VTETEGGLEKIAEVLNWRDSKLFSPAERVALEYAERITYTDRQVDDALLDEIGKFVGHFFYDAYLNARKPSRETRQARR